MSLIVSFHSSGIYQTTRLKQDLRFTNYKNLILPKRDLHRRADQGVAFPAFAIILCHSFSV
jgi:hypothetical protein